MRDRNWITFGLQSEVISFSGMGSFLMRTAIREPYDGFRARTIDTTSMSYLGRGTKVWGDVPKSAESARCRGTAAGETYRYVVSALG